eukprot:GILI01013945.1.p1 GENE.GILI01013945.1~~GILI01013945.1.p1  ORF type:complete len:393 (+),score=68.73 GILI01013945.1:85-1263(+)
MDPFRANNQPAPTAPPPQYNPFSEIPASGAQNQPYNPYEQQQHYSPVTNQNQSSPGPQQFYNQSGNYQNTNVAFNPNPPAPGFQQPQFHQPNLSNAPPAPGAPATPGTAPQNRPFNQYAAADQPQGPVQPNSKPWTMEFYQQFFDVDTRQVLLRMGNTLLPITCPDFLSDLGWHWNNQNVATHGPQTSGQPGAAAANAANSMFESANGVLLNKAPDLYGPFWICTTLWMLTAIISNILSKIANTRLNAQNKSNAEANGYPFVSVEWNYDFTQASIALGTVYIYTALLSATLWGIMRWKDLPVGFTHCLCTYGYSMFLFLLAAILCIIPVGFLQWLACMIAAVWSSLYIILNFWFVWRNSLNKAWFLGVLLLVCSCHIGLGLAFRFYFFSYDL